jgi:hypothetical protein
VTEQGFLDHIACCFPYHDETAWRALIDLGRTISPNAAFAVLEEISRPPRGESISPSVLQGIGIYWRANFDHPLADLILDCAMALIDRREIPAQRAYEIMETIAQYPGQYAALNIVYFACEEAEHLSGEVDRRCDAITACWEAEG